MLIISPRIRQKLKITHGVNEDEIKECFSNRPENKKFLQDTRENHLTEPITQWFIAETDCGRLLKIVFISKEENFYIKTAYSPNNEEIRIYNNHS